MSNLIVNMFGEFIIRAEDRSISGDDNRAKKLWLLLAYLIYNRHRVVKQSELIDILWSEYERGANPSGALKTLLYRVRSLLDGLWDGAGKQLIVCQSSGYMWNSNYSVDLDYEEFNVLNERMASSDEFVLEDAMKLLRLHKGEFLQELSSEMWVMPIATYYHNAYIYTLLRTLPVLWENRQYEDIIELCQKTVVSEPYHEDIYCYYMRAYIAMDKQKEAIDIYQGLSDKLLSELGVIPSEETRSIYYEALKSINDHTLTIEMLHDQLQEKNAYPGALICDYDFFRVLYYSMVRSVMRYSMAVHLGLITISGKNDTELTVQKREKIMENLGTAIRNSVRRSDAGARCSATQYIVMLPRANYEDSCMVCERIIKAYYNGFSRLDVNLRYEVFPILLEDRENFNGENK